MSFKYGANQILKDISIQFRKGCLYGILGPNGSGKTTFLKILNGILKTKYGQVKINNSNIKILKPREVAKRIAFVNQTYNLNFNFSVKEIIMMGRFAHIGRFSQKSPEDIKIVNNLIRKFNLKELESRGFNELSGGEQQKVIIAKALAQQSKILLLDEPTNHLDINHQIELMEILKHYINQGLVIVIVLHDINLAAQFCDKIVLLNDGKIKSFGSIKKTITRENLKEVYNIDVVISKNKYSNSIFITPIKSQVSTFSPSENITHSKNIHVIAGGGSAMDILPKLKRFEVSVGVVNVLDDDYALSNELNYKIIAEAPFSQISEKSSEDLRNLLQDIDIIILTNVPFGKANVKNLEIILESNKQIIIYEKTPIEDRDFSGGNAIKIYNNIKNLKHSITVSDLTEVLELLDKND